MRCLHPALCVIGISLFAWGTASAQARMLDITTVERAPGTLAHECHVGRGTHVRDEVSLPIAATTRALANDMPIGIEASAEGVGAVAATASESVGFQRIRAMGSALEAIVAQAATRSRTFRQLVQDINRTDGIVYLEHGRCGHGVRACLLAVLKAGGSRIVRVRVAANNTDWDLMGSVGHELQHAVEVLREPAITNTAAMTVYYRREGYRVGSVFETTAAVRAGNDVRAEVRSPQHARPAARYQPASMRAFERADLCFRLNERGFASPSGFAGLRR